MNEEEKQQHYERAEQLLAEQNPTAAVIAGAFATLLAAVAYAIVVGLWPFASGFAVAGIGVVVGAAIGFLGRGLSTGFAMLAVALTIIGCVLGNVFVSALGRARETASSPFEVLQEIPRETLADWAASSLSTGQFLFWLIAIFAAAFLARRPLSRADRLALGLFRLRD